MSDEIGVGKESLSYCTSCKMDLGHIIVSMKGDKIAKVECKTCKKTHVYRAPKGITEPTKAKKKRASSADAESNSTKPIEVEWERMMKEHQNPEKSYTAKTSFIVGDKIKHTVFGPGFVTRLIFPNKIEVLFQNDMKTLIHTSPKA